MFLRKITLAPLLSVPCILIHNEMKVIFKEDFTVTSQNADNSGGAGVHITWPSPRKNNTPNLSATQNLLHPSVAHHLGLDSKISNICFMSH